MNLTELISVAPPYVALAIPLYLYFKNKENKKILATSVQKADLAIQKIDEHLQECSQIRKEVLLEKIENLDGKVCRISDEAKEFRAEVQASFIRGSAKFDKLNDFLLKQSQP